jgi:hypothetical protein
MRRFLVFVLHLASIIAVTEMCTSLKAQAPSESVRSSLISASIAMKQPEISAGQATWLIIYVKNIDNKSYYSDEFLPHVEGEKGEITRTMYHRQRRHDPSVPGLAGGGLADANEISAAKTTVRRCDLTKYYNLGIPGKYSVYVEYMDETGKWQRTNTVQFTVQSPAK